MTEFKDFSNKKCCLTCDGFCWWDGDYCCTMEMKIHQYCWPHQIWFDRDIDKTMVLGKNCKDYHKWGTYMYVSNCPNEFLEEYKKFKEWDKLCWQLEQHVNDPSGVYENIIKPRFYSNIKEFFSKK